jgi:hydroxypyruvate isomerase
MLASIAYHALVSLALGRLPVSLAVGRWVMKRREFLAKSSAVSTALVAAGVGAGSVAADDAPAGSAAHSGEPVVKIGRARQSVMGWCFNPMDAVTLAKHAKAAGLVAMEGIPASSYPEVTAMGLAISLASSHGFATGPLDPDNHAVVTQKLREGIDLAVKFNCPSVITFTGMTKAGISEQAAQRNCLKCWRDVIPYAEEKGITLVLEHLNTRDDSHPMKGHPGYWGDDLELCADLVRKIDSPRFRLLFDVYHVQIMHGDLIRNIRRYHPLVGHYHTAGNPGRCELDENQEINYPAVIRAILDTGYQGYIAQEFIPTWDDPIAALRHAAAVCDV